MTFVQKLLFSLLIFLVCRSTHAQNHYQKYWDVSENFISAPGKPRRGPDGAIYAKFADRNSGIKEVGVVKFDDDMNIIWARSFDDIQNSLDGIGFEFGADSMLYVINGSKNWGTGVGSNETAVHKMTLDGEVVWSKVFNGYFNLMPKNITYLEEDSTLYLACQAQGGVSAGIMATMKLDLNGDIISQRQIYDTLGWQITVNHCEGDNGSIYLTGTAQNQLIPGDEDNLLAKFDKDLNYLWGVSYGGFNIERDASSGQGNVYYSGDSLVYVTASTSSFGEGNYDVMFSCFDTSGTHLWSKTIGTTDRDYCQADNFLMLGDTIVMTVQRHDGSETGNSNVLRFDRDGNLLSSKQYGPFNGYCRVTQLQEDGEDGLLMVTNLQNTVAQDPDTSYFYRGLIRTNREGEGVCYVRDSLEMTVAEIEASDIHFNSVSGLEIGVITPEAVTLNFKEVVNWPSDTGFCYGFEEIVTCENDVHVLENELPGTEISWKKLDDLETVLGSSDSYVSVADEEHVLIAVNEEGDVIHYSFVFDHDSICQTITVNGEAIACIGNELTLNAFGASNLVWTDVEAPSVVLESGPSYTFVLTDTIEFEVRSLDAGSRTNFTVNAYPCTGIIVDGLVSEYCIGESVSLTVTGDLGYEFVDQSTLQLLSSVESYSIDSLTSGTSILVTGDLGQQTSFDIVVKDSRECYPNDVADTVLFCANETVLTEVEGYPPFEWRLLEDQNILLSSEAQLEIDTASSFSVVVTNIYGVVDTVHVLKDTERNCLPLIVYELISPNGDEKNDAFYVERLEDFPLNELWIYNKWGAEVMHSENYENADQWEGSELPDGSYYYVLKVSGIEEEFKGRLVIRH